MGATILSVVRRIELRRINRRTEGAGPEGAAQLRNFVSLRPVVDERSLKGIDGA
jgi:hypothetical protein